MSVAASSVYRTFYELEFVSQKIPHWIGYIPGSIFAPALILSGLLADRRFGNYKVARFGLIVLFIGTLGISIYAVS